MKNRNLEHKDDWATPKYFYDKLNQEFDFNFDPCPLKHDTSKWDGLKIEWKERNYINPPYSRKLKEAFVLKAIEESKKGKLCVMLLPVSTSTQLFHKYILPNAKEIRFVEKRVKFLGVNTKGEFVENKAGMHDSMVVVFDGRNTNVYESEKKSFIKKFVSLADELSKEDDEVTITMIINDMEKLYDKQFKNIIKKQN